MAMSRAEKARTAAGAYTYEVADWAVNYPMLWEHLSEEAWEDGSRRTGSTLLLFCEEGMVKGCLNDRGEQRTAWASGKTVEDLFYAFEKRLEQKSMEWRSMVTLRAGKK